MKNSIILYFVVLIIEVLSSKYAEKRAEAEIKCIDNFHLNQTEIEEIMKLPILPDDNDDLSNFLNCVWNELGFKNADGSANFGIIKSAELEKYDDQTFFVKIAISIYLQSLTELCQKQNGDSEINVVKMVNCIKKYNQDMQTLTERN